MNRLFKLIVAIIAVGVLIGLLNTSANAEETNGSIVFFANELSNGDIEYSTDNQENWTSVSDSLAQAVDGKITLSFARGSKVWIKAEGNTG